MALEQIRSLRWKLVVVGTGEFEEGLRNMLAAAGLSDRVVFTGYIPHDQTPRVSQCIRHFGTSIGNAAQLEGTIWPSHSRGAVVRHTRYWVRFRGNTAFSARKRRRCSI